MRISSSMLRRAGVWAGACAFGLAVLSSLVALTIRDAVIPSALVFFGVPWLVRLGLSAFAWLVLRPRLRKWRVLLALVILHSLIQGGQSFRWRSAPAAPPGSFEITLWNAGRNLRKMPREWPRLAGADTRLVVLVEAGALPPDVWKQFTAVHPDFTWQRLDGGIVVGVKGRLIDSTALGDQPRFRCHRVRVEIDGLDYSVFAVDIPSQPWLPREPFLDRIREVSTGNRSLVLGDFNTPPEARGYDAWRGRFVLANDAKATGFLETWCHGLPVLALDQLWLGGDVEAVGASQTLTLRSDHVRMNFRVRPKRVR